MSNALLELDLPRGTRLAVLGENSSETLLVYASALLAGVGTILVNYHLTTDELQYLLDDGAAQAIWSSPESLPKATAAAGQPRTPRASGRAEHGRWPSRVEAASHRRPPGDLPTTTDSDLHIGDDRQAQGGRVPQPDHSDGGRSAGVDGTPPHGWDSARTLSSGRCTTQDRTLRSAFS